MIFEIIGVIKSGNMILRYLTMAPRKLTVYPIVIKIENDKKIENRINGVMCILLLHVKTNRNKRRIKLISTAAAKDKRCFTSVGKGLSRDKLTAWGAFFIKLPKVGVSSFVFTSELPSKITGCKENSYINKITN